MRVVEKLSEQPLNKPIIMMSQNRAPNKNRTVAAYDYEVNLRAD